MKVAHPAATGVITTGSYKVYSVYVTPAAADATITVVNSADGTGTPETVAVVIAKASTNTTQVVFPGGVTAGLGIYISALSGAGAKFGVQYDG